MLGRRAALMEPRGVEDAVMPAVWEEAVEETGGRRGGALALRLESAEGEGVRTGERVSELGDSGMSSSEVSIPGDSGMV